MELGLSLGPDIVTSPSASKQQPSEPFKISDSGKINGLGFCMADPDGTPGNLAGKSRRSSEDDDDRDSEDGFRRNGLNHVPSRVESPIHLGLGLTPVHAHHHWSSDNGSSENGSSGNIGMPAARGFDVNRVPAAAGDEVSSPNSVASSFQMDIRMFRRGGSTFSGGGNKRISSESDPLAGNEGGDGERASSRASDDDENGVNTRKKLRLSKEQSAFLEESFKEHHTLNPKQKLALAKQLNLRPRQVEVWFQNRRARTKLKQTEVDCEYLKRCCETLTEENRRLHKELQELRALKTSNPFYMQLPATTLTMCPSCERVATTSTTGTTTTTTTTSAPPVNANTNTNTPKVIPFPISRPGFNPFSHAAPAHPNQPTASKT